MPWIKVKFYNYEFSADFLWNFLPHTVSLFLEHPKKAWIAGPATDVRKHRGVIRGRWKFSIDWQGQKAILHFEPEKIWDFATTDSFFSVTGLRFNKRWSKVQRSKKKWCKKFALTNDQFLKVDRGLPSSWKTKTSGFLFSIL